MSLVVVRNSAVVLQDFTHDSSGSFGGVHTPAHLLTHPKLGASWEGFALEEILQAHQPDQAWFYVVHSRAEVDLLMEIRGRRVGVEFKWADAPRVTRSMHTAITDTALDELWVVYPGTRSYSLGERITVLPLAACLDILPPWASPADPVDPDSTG